MHWGHLSNSHTGPLLERIRSVPGSALAIPVTAAARGMPDIRRNRCYCKNGLLSLSLPIVVGGPCPE